MHFQHTYAVSLDPAATFAVHRDRLPEFGPQLPGVERVELTKLRPHSGDRLRLYHRWQGDRSFLPRLLRPLIPAEAFQWTDETEWCAATGRCDWQMKVPVLGDGFQIDGDYVFVPVEDGTEVTVRAVMRFAPDGESPFATTALGRRMLPLVERFVVALFQQVMSRSTEVIRMQCQTLHPSVHQARNAA